MRPRINDCPGLELPELGVGGRSLVRGPALGSARLGQLGAQAVRVCAGLALRLVRLGQLVLPSGGGASLVVEAEEVPEALKEVWLVPPQI